MPVVASVAAGARRARAHDQQKDRTVPANATSGILPGAPNSFERTCATPVSAESPYHPAEDVSIGDSSPDHKRHEDHLLFPDKPSATSTLGTKPSKVAPQEHPGPESASDDDGSSAENKLQAHVLGINTKPSWMVDGSGIDNACLTITRATIKRIYHSNTTMYLVALLIVANFLVNCLEAQFVDQYTGTFFVMELFFTVVFSVELAFNLAADWYSEFIGDYWNWLDAIVVVISLMSVTMGGVAGVSSLRLLRAFRVVRLFRRAASLRKILAAIQSAIPGMRDAFAILMLVMMLYAILAVQLYHEDNDEYFGTFLKAFFTMFQMMTTEGWAEIARETMRTSGDSHSLFFVSFIMVGNIILANVVIAVLIEQVCMKGEDENERMVEETENYDAVTAKLLEADLHEWQSNNDDNRQRMSLDADNLQGKREGTPASTGPHTASFNEMTAEDMISIPGSTRDCVMNDATNGRHSDDTMGSKRIIKSGQSSLSARSLREMRISVPPMLSGGSDAAHRQQSMPQTTGMVRRDSKSVNVLLRHRKSSTTSDTNQYDLLSMEKNIYDLTREVASMKDILHESLSLLKTNSVRLDALESALHLDQNVQVGTPGVQAKATKATFHRV
mmetsp:Transcript_28450/g.54261  ORF Transcript_28450/g.54261 Transcript_28450/m.54261 type:complete len:616 (-) Transcript_28450:357-2204(-)|eukprot:CAMPEP_0114246318 /NCGR_PEP_ID=MMETSP0058-20121206/12392_1 /TAXON_ID=36894 /ORGANISM="Pyramimonas parkeae, CCMP726" /LENGTH=615 /DNA_ID=CAMNT_0001359483 /DNA_START=348 /DNA_END=2195 /DNA_ORIENTATION=+